MIKNVIFDLDGTLTDTEKYYRKAWPLALKEFGYDMTDEQALSIRSLGRPFAPELFKKWYGDDFDYNKIRTYRRGLVKSYIEEFGLELKPGAKEILAWLRENGICTALATANEFDRTKKILTKVGIFDSFDEIICANMVKFGKPAPDIYRYAIEKLKAKPEECIAVEDSPNGVKSAYEAGCKVVFVPDQTEPDAEVKNMMFARVSSLTEIEDVIRKENSYIDLKEK